VVKVLYSGLAVLLMLGVSGCVSWGAENAEQPAIGDLSLGTASAAGMYGSQQAFLDLQGIAVFSEHAQLGITHIAFYPEYDLRTGESVPEAALVSLSQRLSDYLDVPAAEVSPDVHVWSDSGWGYSYELQQLDTAGGDTELRILLQTNDPRRLCGSEDGFMPWFQHLQRAIAMNDVEWLATAFDYPFYDQMGSVLAVPDSARMHFQDAWDLRERYGDTAVRAFFVEVAAADVDCDPIGYESHAGGYRLSLAEGAVQALPRQQGWRLIVRYYLP
jgi:hypothetical protein